MSSFLLPKSITEEVTKKIKNFLWNSFPQGKKLSPMQWSVVTKPKKLGGLGIKDLRLSNKAFMQKHIWRLLTDSTSLWARTYKCKYFPNSNILEATRKSNASWAWKGIAKNISDLKGA